MVQEHPLKWTFPEVEHWHVQPECSCLSTQSPLRMAGKQDNGPTFSPRADSSCAWQELFCVCGALKRARLVHPRVAEVVFVKKDDAITAYKKYNNRCLDGKSGKQPLHPATPHCFLSGSRPSERAFV